MVLTCKKKKLEGYIDASFGCHHDGKSHSGLVVKLGESTILTGSTKQKIVTKSSTEAELVALSDYLPRIEWIEEFLAGQGYVFGAPVVYQDNTSTIALVRDGGGKYRSKHMRTRQAGVKEKVDNKTIELKHLPTERMIADTLTKPLQGALGRAMTRALLNTKAAKDDGPTGVRWRNPISGTPKVRIHKGIKPKELSHPSFKTQPFGRNR
jgi:hypothetical protein